MVVFFLGAVALVVRHNGVSGAGATDAGAILQRPRAPASERDSMPLPRSFGAASKSAENDRLDGDRAARLQDTPARQEVTTRGDAPLGSVNPATGLAADDTRADEPPRAREESGASPEGPLPRFNLDGEAPAESPRPHAALDGEVESVAAPKPRFGVNGEAVGLEDKPVAKLRLGVNGEVADAAKARIVAGGEEAVAKKQPRFGVNGEAEKAEVRRGTPVAEARTREVPSPVLDTRSKLPDAGVELPSRKGDSFGLDSDEPAVVAPALTKASGVLTATKTLPADTLSPDDDPEPPHLLGEIHEQLSLHTDERLSRFEELVAAVDPRSDRSSAANGLERLSSDSLGARGSAPESSGVGVDPAVVWKPKDPKAAADAGSSRPLVEEEQPRTGLRAEEVDTDIHAFLDAADLLDGHPRRSEHDQTAGGYKGKAIVERSL